MECPEAWKKVIENVGQKGKVVMMIGASDTGKTTFSRLLLKEVLHKGMRAAFIDADVGQSVIGPPTTLGLSLLSGPEDLESPRPFCLYFLGATSPAQGLLPAVVGLAKLYKKALSLEVDFVLVDTTGLVAGDIGFQLKYYEVEVIAPTDLIALQRGMELEHILRALRSRGKPLIWDVAPSAKVQRRDQIQRQLYRFKKFKEYFEGASLLEFDLKEVPLVDPTFPHAEDIAQRAIGRVVGLIDGEGFALGIGIIAEAQGTQLKVLTPVKEIEGVRALHLGRVVIDGGGQKIGNPPTDVVR